MRRVTGLSLCVPALLALALRAHAAELPKHPDQLTFKPLVYTPPSAKDHRVVLKAGPVVYIAEDRELPLVNISIALRGGTYLVPRGKEGLAELTGYLMARGGTRTRTAEELEERLAFLAANLGSSYGDERGAVTLNLLSKDLDEGLRILREVLTEPRFQEDKLKLRKDQLLSDMKQRNDSSADIEARELGFLAEGEDYYANWYETKASLDSITREDLVAFHRKWLDLRNVMVAVSGDVSRPEMLKKLEALFAKWPVHGEAALAIPVPKHRMPSGLFVVDKDVNQGRVDVVVPGLQRDDSDFFPALLMNYVLGGGGFASRITNRVRSDEGLAYQAGSRLSGGTYYPGTLNAFFQSKVRSCSYATQVVLDEMKRMRAFGADPATAKADAAELETAKASFIETFPRRFATKAQVVGALLDEELTGRYRTNPTYFATFRANVEKVTAADVKRVADRLLATPPAILVVGKKADLLDPDPKHPVKYAELAGGKLVDVPLRDPLTMKPLPAER